MGFDLENIQKEETSSLEDGGASVKSGAVKSPKVKASTVEIQNENLLNLKNKNPVSKKKKPTQIKPNEKTQNDTVKDADKLSVKDSQKTDQPGQLENSKEVEAQKQKTDQPIVPSTIQPEVLPEAEEIVEESHVFSVSEINKGIRSILEKQFAFIWLQGEISNFKAHTSGHFYFSLKDNNSQISAVMFKGFNNRLKFKPKDGQEVLIRGKITVYEPRGNYQIFCEIMEPVGAGALQIAFEQLKAKLQSEGMFSIEKKKKLPPLPKHIALVTSPTGAAVRDMLNVLSRRFKGVDITIIPVMVQGEKAAPSIVEGIRKANLIKSVDVLIVGRGGGSIEDLWAFNEEAVARAIFNSKKPIISAVGHEVDFTIADFVADLRAPTPSAAAELVIQNAADLIHRVDLQKKRLWNLFQANFQNRRMILQGVSKRLIDPRRKLMDLILRGDELSQRLEASVKRFLGLKKTQVQLKAQKLTNPSERIKQINKTIDFYVLRLKNGLTNKMNIREIQYKKLVSLLDSLSPLKVVERGYSITKKDNVIVKNVNQVKMGDKIEVNFAVGGVTAEITNTFNKKD